MHDLDFITTRILPLLISMPQTAVLGQVCEVSNSEGEALLESL